MNRLLSWPGAKYRQMDAITALAPRDPRIIVEPFFGTGAFTWTMRKFCGAAWAAEGDAHLYWWWRNLIEHTDEMVEAMAAKREEFADAQHDRAVFDALRDGYNEMYGMDARGLETAAQLWVLVYQSTNNLARFNSSGWYNQTWGKGRKVPDPREVFGPEERFALSWWRMALVDGFQGDFRECLDCFLNYGDKDEAVVFLDPPYLVRTETYQRGCWTLPDEQDLWRYCEWMDEADIPWLMTNYLRKDDTVHPLEARIRERWRVVPLKRMMDARPTAGGTPAEEVVVLGGAVGEPIRHMQQAPLFAEVTA